MQSVVTSFKQRLHGWPFDGNGVVIVVYHTKEEAEDGHGHEDAVLHFLFLGVIPNVFAAFAIGHLVRQVLVRHKKYNEEDYDDGEYVENEDVLEASRDILTVLFGVSAEPKEVPIS